MKGKIARRAWAHLHLTVKGHCATTNAHLNISSNAAKLSHLATPSHHLPHFLYRQILSTMAPFSTPTSAPPPSDVAPSKKEEYMLKLLDIANALPADDMALLQQQEREVRDEIEKNPTKKAYWELLLRMVPVSEKNSAELHRRYDIGQKKKEKEAEMKRIAEMVKKREGEERGRGSGSEEGSCASKEACC
jgi:hypothetical protein